MRWISAPVQVSAASAELAAAASAAAADVSVLLSEYERQDRAEEEARELGAAERRAEPLDGDLAPGAAACEGRVEPLDVDLALGAAPAVAANDSDDESGAPSEVPRGEHCALRVPSRLKTPTPRQEAGWQECDREPPRAVATLPPAAAVLDPFALASAEQSPASSLACSPPGTLPGTPLGASLEDPFALPKSALRSPRGSSAASTPAVSAEDPFLTLASSAPGVELVANAVAQRAASDSETSGDRLAQSVSIEHEKSPQSEAPPVGIAASTDARAVIAHEEVASVWAAAEAAVPEAETARARSWAEAMELEKLRACVVERERARSCEVPSQEPPGAASEAAPVSTAAAEASPSSIARDELAVALAAAERATAEAATAREKAVADAQRMEELRTRAEAAEAVAEAARSELRSRLPVPRHKAKYSKTPPEEDEPPQGTPPGPLGRLFRSQMERAIRERDAQIVLLEQQNVGLAASASEARARATRAADDLAAARAWRASVEHTAGDVPAALPAPQGTPHQPPSAKTTAKDSVPAMMSALSLVASECREVVFTPHEDSAVAPLDARRQMHDVLQGKLRMLQGRVERFVGRIEAVAQSREASRATSRASPQRSSATPMVEDTLRTPPAAAKSAVTPRSAQEAMISVLRTQLAKVQRSSALYEASILADEAAAAPTEVLVGASTVAQPCKGPAIASSDAHAAPQSPSCAATHDATQTPSPRPSAAVKDAQTPSPRHGPAASPSVSAVETPSPPHGEAVQTPSPQPHTRTHSETQTPSSAGSKRRRGSPAGSSFSGSGAVPYSASPRRRQWAAFEPLSARSDRDALGGRRVGARAASARLLFRSSESALSLKSPPGRSPRRATRAKLEKEAPKDIFWRLDMCAASKGWRVVEVFRQFDRDRDGRLNGHEMTEMVRFLLPGATAAQARTFYVLCDFDGNGGVSYTELSRALEERRASGFSAEASERVSADDVLRRLATHVRRGPDTEMLHRVFSAPSFGSPSLGGGKVSVGSRELNRLVADAMPALDSYERRLLMEDVRRKVDAKHRGRIPRDALIAAVKRAESRRPRAAKERPAFAKNSPMKGGVAGTCDSGGGDGGGGAADRPAKTPAERPWSAADISGW